MMPQTTQTPRAQITEHNLRVTCADAAWFLQRVVPRGSDEADVLANAIATLRTVAGRG